MIAKQSTCHHPIMFFHYQKNQIMTRKFIYVSLLAILITGLALPSCKSKKKDTTTPVTTTAADTTPAPSAAPVDISGNDELTKGVTDATKDFPGVSATVSDGEITLTGTIKRDRLPVLMQSIQALHPKKVNNNLTVQP